MRRERDFSGLFLSNIGSSTVICKGDRGQGRDAVNQPLVSPYQVKKKSIKGNSLILLDPYTGWLD